MDQRSNLSTPRCTRRYPKPDSRTAAPYTELNIFPTQQWNVSQPIAKPARRRGLASLPFVFTMPSEAVDNSDFRPSTPGGSASTFLDALRRRTLLDLSCMREFSLLRTKPLPERNLSRLSVSSAYNMHTEQLHLQQFATPQGTENDTDIRKVSPIKRQTPRISHSHRKISASGAKPAQFNEFTRKFTTSPPTKVPHNPPQQKPIPVSYQTASSTTPKLSVAEQHGFLQEQDLAALMMATGYSRAELFARWARFKALCSMAKNSHGVDKETLRHGVPQLSSEDQFFVDRAFDVLDTDGSGALDWPEFIAALSALEKGDASRRIDFLFHAYDVNGDGYIQRHEVQMFFLASLLVPQTSEAVEVARHFVDKIFISLGREHSDSIRVEDAMIYLHEHPATDAFSILGRTMVSTPPSTPAPVGIRPRRKPRIDNDEAN
ncbi:hypothetical protein PC129_g13288 [Phytophthora cactorum]|uniref:EF-hand domain-containing protein n=2 Tax=Phytophthora cactorum TaxID=29920 RepID=A0A329RSI4_9STRA|nr:EF-Hand 1, calcium-binding site [Phytophthora cactorum]KAG2780367.1 hypothetical protein Pcac1_g9542 [Phytophthora cactorum]KAG2812336.1 hypothetical protein PC112_g15223 [Phytophthora cactorum]KAG2814377.1 hypothetical protein PC111_g14010 [Phytophthora cactorum]KAG2852153.1 hypothetical protein PC113_g15276 [Phytophthora cactorum]